MAIDTLQASKDSGVHRQLALFSGNWSGTMKTWFEPEVLANESPVEGSVELLMDGNFIQHSYRSSFQDKPVSGLSVYGYHLATQTIKNSWIDSFHTGSDIMFSEGRALPEMIEVKGTYFAGHDQPAWGWRTTLALPEENTFVITSYNVDPDGQEAKAVEIVYQRKDKA